MRAIELTRGYVAFVDDEDFALVSPHAWAARGSEDRSVGLYAVATINGRVVRMHNLLMQPPPGFLVDHRDGDGLNNSRAENLRVCTPKQNAANRRQNANSSTSYKGVSIVRGRYVQAQIGNAYIGRFPNETAAALAYDEAAITAYGDFANLNFDRSRDWIINGVSVGVRAC